jgi:hypothetical protein
MGGFSLLSLPSPVPTRFLPRGARCPGVVFFASRCAAVEGKENKECTAGTFAQIHCAAMEGKENKEIKDTYRFRR